MREAVAVGAAVLALAACDPVEVGSGQPQHKASAAVKVAGVMGNGSFEVKGREGTWTSVKGGRRCYVYTVDAQGEAHSEHQVKDNKSPANPNGSTKVRIQLGGGDVTVVITGCARFERGWK